MEITVSFQLLPKFLKLKIDQMSYVMIFVLNNEKSAFPRCNDFQVLMFGLEYMAKKHS